MSKRPVFLTAILAVVFAASVASAGYVGWPCSGKITSDYGPRPSPCSGCSTYHYGVDLGVASGTYLGAPSYGTVSSYVWDSCGGNIYTLKYTNGWTSRFMHCSGSLVGVGSSVTRNQSVAKSGNTGSCTTGAHLHFEMRKDGVAQSIPGSIGSYVTRNVNIAKDFVGLNDTTLPTYTLDNSSSYFSVVGTWATGTSAADKYGTDYRYHSTAAVSEPASWARSVTAGTYKIYAWWPAGTNRSKTAPYILPGNTASTAANQQANGGKWNLLGTKSLSGTATTKLSVWTTTGYVVMADAIRYAP